MFNSLQIKIMGMIESKKKNKVKKDVMSEYQSEAHPEVEGYSSAAATPGKKNPGIMVGSAAEDKLTELEKKNQELMMQLEAARRANSSKAACCTIF